MQARLHTGGRYFADFTELRIACGDTLCPVLCDLSGIGQPEGRLGQAEIALELAGYRFPKAKPAGEDGFYFAVFLHEPHHGKVWLRVSRSG